MNKMYLTFILTAIISVFSCHKKQEDPIIINDDKTLNVIWEHQFPDNIMTYASMDPILFENTLLSSYQSLDTTENEKIISLDINNGNLLWSWDDYIRPIPQRVRGSERNYIYNGSLISCSSQDNYSINAYNGTTNWSTNNENGGPRISIYNELIFHTETYGNAPSGDSSNILMCNAVMGSWEKVVGISKSDEYEVRLHTPAVYVDSNLDTLILYQNRQFTFDNTSEKSDLYCFNISTNEMLWFNENITSSGSSNARASIIKGDKIYFAGKFDIISLNVESGEELWRHNFYWDYQGSNYLIYNDLIITNLDNGDLIAINKNTGNQVWVNEGLSYCCTELRVYGDRIYFGNDKLFIVDANSGDLLYKFPSPNPGGSFINAIAVDLPNQKMYTSDGKYIMCMELPE